MQKKVIKLTAIRTNEKILIGTESIIDAKSTELKNDNQKVLLKCTRIESRGAMVSTSWVQESVEEIYNLINN
jgi:hypothetical protein